MKSYYSFTFAFIFSSIFFVVFSSTVSAETASDKLASIISQMNSFSAHFEQTVQGSKNAKGDHSAGSFDLERPGKFRWETLTPYHQTLVSTGKELWAYEPDIESATVQNLEQGLGSTPALLLSSSNEQLKKSFLVEETSADVFTLKPIEKTTNFEQIKLTFERKKLKELKLIDTLGNETTVAFIGVILNDKIAADKFTFTPRKGVDVIDNRK